MAFRHLAIMALLAGLSQTAIAREAVDPKDAPTVTAPSAYEQSVTFGSTLIHMRMTTEGQAKVFSSFINGNPVAQAIVPQMGANSLVLSDPFNEYLKMTAAAIKQSGTDPRDLGLAYSRVEGTAPKPGIAAGEMETLFKTPAVTAGDETTFQMGVAAQ